MRRFSAENRCGSHAAPWCHKPGFVHGVIDLDAAAAGPGSLVSSKANAARPQWNDAIRATCSYNSATFRPGGANDRLVVAWYLGLGT
jgi:hypothetical protein